MERQLFYMLRDMWLFFLQNPEESELGSKINAACQKNNNKLNEMSQTDYQR